jgi:hypothetical protein
VGSQPFAPAAPASSGWILAVRQAPPARAGASARGSRRDAARTRSDPVRRVNNIVLGVSNIVLGVNKIEAVRSVHCKLR